MVSPIYNLLRVSFFYSDMIEWISVSVFHSPSMITTLSLYCFHSCTLVLVGLEFILITMSPNWPLEFYPCPFTVYYPHISKRGPLNMEVTISEWRHSTGHCLNFFDSQSMIKRGVGNGVRDCPRFKMFRRHTKNCNV